MRFSSPTEAEFSDVLGATPVTRPSSLETIYVYEFADPRGCAVRLSFDVVAGSVQTALSLGGAPLSVVSMEGATSLRIVGRAIEARFEFDGARAEMRLLVEPQLSLTWSTLLA